VPASGAQVSPFRFLAYDTAVAGPLGTLVAPPYDVVSPALRDDLAARSPHNAVHLDLPSGDYGAVPAIIGKWTAAGALRRAPEPVVIAWTQSFTLPGGGLAVRRTILATVALEPYSSRVVRPHERTHAGPKEERLRLMRATGHILSPVFGLYPDPAGAAWAAAAVDGPPHAELTDDEGTTHRFWTVSDPGAHAAVAAAIAGHWILIADGHHRYETALAYRDLRRAEDGGGSGTRPYDLVMMGLTALEDPGLVVLPTHRVLARWSEDALAGLPATPVADVGALEDALARTPSDQPVVGVVTRDAHRVVTLPASSDSSPAARLDLSVIERTLLVPHLGGDQAALARDGALTYVKDAREAARMVRDGRAEAALIVRGIPKDRVAEVAEAGEVMPQKSTYFFPKLLTGVAFQPLA
jgi:uncharacterized protein (DUF1015 family)